METVPVHLRGGGGESQRDRERARERECVCVRERERTGHEVLDPTCEWDTYRETSHMKKRPPRRNLQ